MGKSVDEGWATVTFYPLKGAVFINDENIYFRYKGKIYSDAWDAAHQRDYKNTDEVANLSKYHAAKGSSYFTEYYDFKRIDWLTPQAKLVYGRGFIKYYLDGNKLMKVDLNKPLTLLSVEEMDSPPIDLTLACATHIHLLIEAKSIKNIADKDNLSFIGSTVRIVRRCDDMSTPPHKIDFFYFFKDKNKVYYYYTNQTEMKVLEGLNPDDYEPDNYNDLKELESYTNEEPIETERIPK